MHACQVAAAAGAGAAERTATAFVGNAMPNQWGHAPGTVPPAFTEIARRARRIHEMLGSVPLTELFKRIEDEAIRLGRSNAEDHLSATPTPHFRRSQAYRGAESLSTSSSAWLQRVMGRRFWW